VQGLCEDDEGAFLRMLTQAWFSFYRRGEQVSSCGFEHTFVGEVDDGHVKGLHNWIQVSPPPACTARGCWKRAVRNRACCAQTMIEEVKGNLEYMGAILPRHRRHGDDKTDSGERRLISIQLGRDGEIKVSARSQRSQAASRADCVPAQDVSSMFVGTSPEFELALYSLCFFAGQEENRVTVGDYDLTIKCYRIRSKYGDKVSTAFPVPDE